MTLQRRSPAGRSSQDRATSWGYLQLHPIASVDCRVVRALQEVVEGQRRVITGVDVPFRIREAHTADSWRKGTVIRTQRAEMSSLRWAVGWSACLWPLHAQVAQASPSMAAEFLQGESQQ